MEMAGHCSESGVGTQTIVPNKRKLCGGPVKVTDNFGFNHLHTHYLLDWSVFDNLSPFFKVPYGLKIDKIVFVLGHNIGEK